MTKAEKILALYDGKISCRAIGALVGCSDAYVRVVARQRKGRGQSEHDLRYNAKVQAKGDRAKARAASRAAYRAARRAGLRSVEANQRAGSAYTSKLRATGAKAIRREAAL